MASYEYNESDLPEVTKGRPIKLDCGSDSSVVRSGEWTMEYVNPAHHEDGDSLIEVVDQTILAWIAYRNWLAENPPERANNHYD